MNWSRHHSFHRARNLLGFSNVCGCESGTEIILWFFMDLWETGVYERFGIGRLPLCRCLKKNHFCSIGRSLGGSSFRINPSKATSVRTSFSNPEQNETLEGRLCLTSISGL
ncbi:unnamed protein product [Rangifer tarandus platyrhynchus]|uniref:Uncharacterized protein n=1 Tax=Rangifer tarandus platyrhynchus TaxID=3082113 RepID=A0ABN8ZLQ8_RANTA|nr:unnamed protein product [Rangifer tarandus platyrhynchus]